MKTSSRRRKLEYIREKNHYRLGGECKDIITIPYYIINNFTKYLIFTQANIIIKNISRKFKLDFSLVEVKLGLSDEELTTFNIVARLTLKVIK